MEAKVYNQKGKETGMITLPEDVFGVSWNADLVHQVAVSIMSNKRANTADARMRGEVSGGGKKPWKQKGTGRARHGSSRSPIWKGGGVTHGPNNDKNYNLKINKKMMIKALYTALSEKMRKGQVLFVDTLAMSEIKTKNAEAVLKNLATISGFERLGTWKKEIAHVVVAERTSEVVKSYQNLPQVGLADVKNINVLDILNHKYLVIANPEASVNFISGKMASKTKSK